jgi:hypothetical protein
MDTLIKERILVVLINGKNYFLAVQVKEGMSEVIFFDRFDYGQVLWSVTEKPTTIFLLRDNEEFDKATLYVSSEIESSINLGGFNKLRENLEAPLKRDWTNHIKDKEIRSQSFIPGDILVIDKEWARFENQGNWISEITEVKGYHGSFFKLFEQIDCFQKVKEFFDFDVDDLVLTSIIFISPTCVEELKRVYL